jgi:hypothetical protein
MDRLTDARRHEPRDLLAAYLKRNGVEPRLAYGTAGDRALALGLAYGAKPADVFAHWMAELLDLRVDEAEDLGWIALLASGVDFDRTLFARDLDTETLRALRVRTLLPRTESRLAMPAQPWRAPDRALGRSLADHLVGRRA